MKRPLLAALAAGCLTLTAPATASASASAGIDVRTYRISYLQYPETGKARAQLRNITVTWRRDRADKRVWVTVSAQLRDSGPGDGHCARMTLLADSGYFALGKTTVKECNGVWQTRSLASEPGNFELGTQLLLQTNPNGSWTSRNLTNPWDPSPGR
ncbi:hypothetical protein Nocox_13055 [Nonomuraea coxensis DSM 45129]|uniref:Secreted protein n=1 Tax=Nonomuraea coxensis DSM 45129 TaxID=1122611 RepID=A0ABX8U0I2_9ACTN|nr:hypothetical protein [Nonomuraea coxensis]QYC40229.1 hypothetical protein Nocox_13055 [Nonomuraea coxensis DSM 45129]